MTISAIIKLVAAAAIVLAAILANILIVIAAALRDRHPRNNAPAGLSQGEASSPSLAKPACGRKSNNQQPLK